MNFQPIERPAGAFQQSLDAGQIQAVCSRVFGPAARVLEAVELGGGLYNSTYRITLTEKPNPVVLRVAPEHARQFRSERQLMRNEYASVPWLTCLAPMMPAVIAADWSHQIIARDYMVQSFLGGVPAPRPSGRLPALGLARILPADRRHRPGRARDPRPVLRAGLRPGSPHLG